MNPVAMAIINPRKEYRPSRGSNQRSPVLKTTTLPTELWSSAFHEYTITYDDDLLSVMIHGDTLGHFCQSTAQLFLPFN